MQCKICNCNNSSIFKATILNKYYIEYYHCLNCGFLQTEEPYWLEEAYTESINLSDTGIMTRNLSLTQKVSIIIFFLFKNDGKFIDFAGGYGIFTRLMRDVGFDFLWHDPYTVNLVARGFEYREKSEDQIELITSFESFEHFVNPLDEIEKMLGVTKNILFSTNLLPENIPKPDEWWYYGLEHGQHISFYSKKTLQFLAKKYKLNLYTDGNNIHLLTEKTLNNQLFNIIVKLNRMGIFYIIKRFIRSKTIQDMYTIVEKEGLK